MTQKENEDFAHYFMTYLVEAEKSDDAYETANTATDMVKEILSKHPQIRHVIWLYGQEHLLNELGLDYGKPK
jgi:hypothetical protein